MGYTTEFEGRIAIDPPLSAEEVAYLKKFADTRRMLRAKGPYFVDGSGFMGQGSDSDVIDHNNPDKSQPGLWCQWVPTEDGKHIEWNGSEKFYNSAEWMEYLITHFIGDLQLAKRHLPFIQPHRCNGVIKAQGESITDRWELIVNDNEVTTKKTYKG